LIFPIITPIFINNLIRKIAECQEKGESDGGNYGAKSAKSEKYRTLLFSSHSGVFVNLLWIAHTPLFTLFNRHALFVRAGEKRFERRGDNPSANHAHYKQIIYCCCASEQIYINVSTPGPINYFLFGGVMNAH